MPPKINPLLTVPLSVAAIEALAAPTVLDRRTADVIEVEPTNGSVTPALARAAAETLARMIVTQQWSWPCTPADVCASLERLGTKREAAKASVEQLIQQGMVREVAVQANIEQVARALTTQLSMNPYVARAGIGVLRPSDQPAPEPAPEAIAGPPRHVNEVSDYGLPHTPTAAEREADESEVIRAGNATYDAMLLKQAGVAL